MQCQNRFLGAGSFLILLRTLFWIHQITNLIWTLKWLGHISLWKGIWNVSRIYGLALTFPKMVWRSQIGLKMTDLWSFENLQLLQIRAVVAALISNDQSCFTVSRLPSVLSNSVSFIRPTKIIIRICYSWWSFHKKYHTAFNQNCGWAPP